jgi:hypothetical protein
MAGMRGPRTPSLFLLAAMLGAAYAGEPFEAHDKAHGRPELPRLGTIGDRPPLESTLVVHVHADGAIVVDGKETTLDGLSGALLVLHETKREPAVLLRADARLPWKAMQFLLILCAEQKIHRVFHAVLPEKGDEEGAFFWPVPADVADVRGEPARRVDVRIALGGRPATPAHLYHAARGAKPGYVELKVGMAVPTGDVLRAADALCRAGVRAIYIFGTPIPTRAERASDLKPLVKDLAARPRNWAENRAEAKEDVDAETISMRLGNEDLGAAKVDPMPAVERVRGGFAGPVKNVEGVGEVPLEEPEVPLEEPEPEVPLEEPEPEIPEEQVVEPEEMGEEGAEASTEDGPGAPGADAEPAGRGPGGKRVLQPRGRPEVEAVELALAWLAAHQDVADDGKWDCDGFMKHDPADDQCDGAGGALNDVGVTSLAVLAFLGAGYTDRGSAKENKYATHVRAGARYLVLAQAEDGAFGPRETQSFIYNHAMATIAMCDLFWMTKNPRYRKPAQDGLNFLSTARNPFSGWRYRPRGGDSDTSVTVWCLMAVKSGKYAGLEVDPDCFEGAREWIDSVTDAETGRVGYLARGGPSHRPKEMEARWPASQTNAMTAAGTLGRIFLGEDPRDSEMVGKGARLCADNPPAWNPDTGSIDMDYWYFGTLALFQVGGRKWDLWSKAMDSAIVKHQHPKGSGVRKGSWDPLDPWGPDGGRVYATALMTMALEVYYRYDRR